MTKEAFYAAQKIARMPQYIQDELPLGMLYPSSPSLILKDHDSILEGDLKKFGVEFTFKGKKKRLINARAETALDKWSFSYSLKHRRCVIPAAWFYEWDKEKQMVAFYEENHPVLYMAGFWQEDGFIILTTDANASMQPFHHRMPLLLRENQLEDWMYDDHMTRMLLHSQPGMLDHRFMPRSGERI